MAKRMRFEAQEPGAQEPGTQEPGTQGLGSWLKGQMAAHRLGRNDLVRMTGVSAGTISRITALNYIPKVETVQVLADFFGADRDTVLEIAGIVQLSDLDGELPPEMRDLARRLYRLGPGDRRAVLAQFDTVLKLVENRPPR